MNRISFDLVFIQVLVKGDEDLMGKMVQVEIYETGKHFMKSRLVENSEIVTPGLNAPLLKGKVSGFDEDVKLKVLFTVSFRYHIFIAVT